jgi:HD-GYP domain-containing protein (c-di-GMP phosphodiesterase class II)
MREAARFLETLSDLLDVVTRDGMESGELALLLEAARKDVETIRLADPAAKFEIGEGDVFWRGRALAGTVDWPWRQRLLAAEVVKLAPPDETEAFRSWVAALAGRFVSVEEAAGDAPADPVAPIEPGPAPGEPSGGPPAAVVPPAAGFGLQEETERAWWLHGEAANRGQVPRRETEDLIEILVRSLGRGLAAATGRSLDRFDEFTTIHAVNVSLLAMGVGRHLAFDDAEVRALGVAGLYHDVGRVRLDERSLGDDPASEARRALQTGHAEAGARVLMDSGAWFSLAAVVAYEHHLTWRGTGGYPTLQFARAPHQFSRIIAVCDTYDALRTERAHRPALAAEAASEYLRILAGKTLDPEIVTGGTGYASESITWIQSPRTRPEATLADVRWLPDSGFDPDFEPRPLSI